MLVTCCFCFVIVARVAASVRGRDEGDGSSAWTPEQSQQADGGLPAERLQDAGRLLS